MKRFVLFTLCLILVFGISAPLASANSWNLTGDLLEAVSAVDTWDDYIALDKQAGDMALMHSRYHNALMLWDETDKKLYVYTKAVYQPDDGRDGEAKLKKTEDGFTLSYGDAEWYTFCWNEGAYELREAVIGGFRIAPAQDNALYGYTNRYVATDGADRAELRLYIPLSDFNLKLFPRSVDEVRQLNLLRATLSSGSDCLGWVEYPERPGLQTYRNIAAGTEPVYSAPYPSSAWRAAGGKAAVSLQGELWTLKSILGEDGQGYTCIRYDVSARTQRIGYIPASVLDITVSGEGNSVDHLIAADVVAARDTYLTDDPDVSQYPQFTVPEGTRFTCLGLYGNGYAYVSAKVNGGQFADNGDIVWGFVPLKALSLAASGALQTDVMQTMIGHWKFAAGGSMADDELIFRGDGTFTALYNDPETETLVMEKHGIWAVTQYDPSWDLYWNNPPYELTLTYDSGFVIIRGLSFYDQGFSLTNNEGGGGYERLDDH